MTIIHLSFDHPDRIVSRKTKAVRNLISSQNVSDNIVFSLNRTAFRINKLRIQKEAHGYTMYVFGFPFGILLFQWMFIAYKRIARIIIEEDIKPTLIHAHKLTFEGIIAYFLSKKLNVPYILTIRGNADVKLLFYKRLYRKLYSRIVRNAQKVIFLAPWAVNRVESFLGKEVLSNKYSVIPNVVNIDSQILTEKITLKKFITVFYFHNIQGKNIYRIIKAFDEIFLKYPEYSLDIVGGGPQKGKVLSLIKKSKFPDHFNLPGEIEHDTLLKMYSSYQGFILPSFPETFGLVFLEALASGIPVLYSKNSGIDGYFNGLQIGVAVNHQSVDEIIAAIEELIQKKASYKKNIINLISRGFLEQFSKSSVGERYSEIISQYSKRMP